MTDTLHTQINQLTHPDPNVRSEAALALGKMGETMALDALLGALCSEPELMVREDITWALVRLADVAVQPLIGLLTHPDAPVRHHAAHVLGKIGDPRAIEALTAALADDDDSVVLKSAFSLAQMGAESAIPAMVARLGHPSAEVRTTLTSALERFGDAATPAVMGALIHPQWQTREHAADVLAHLGDSAAVTELALRLADEHWAVRFSAVNALGHLANKAILAALLKPVLNDPDARVSNLAGEWLTRQTVTRRGKLPSL